MKKWLDFFDFLLLGMYIGMAIIFIVEVVRDLIH